MILQNIKKKRSLIFLFFSFNFFSGKGSAEKTKTFFKNTDKTKLSLNYANSECLCFNVAMFIIANTINIQWRTRKFNLKGVLLLYKLVY